MYGRRFSEPGCVLAIRSDAGAQCRSVSMEDALQCIAAVARHVKPICHLDGIWCSLTRTTGVLASTIAADELWRSALRQLGAQRGSGAVRQEVHNLTGGHVDQHRAVAMTTA